MRQACLLGRVLLRFGESEEAESIIGELSAAAFDPDGALWVASDELSSGKITLSRLQREDEDAFGRHTQFELRDYADLLAEGEEKTEADIEGLDFADHYLWFTGSHAGKRSRPKGKTREKDLARLARITVEPNRFLLGRIPLLGGTPARSGPHPERPNERLNAARLAEGTGGNVLIEALSGDPHLGPFLRTLHDDDGTDTLLPLASKENGFDIEGLAVLGRRVFLGLRGPVLRGWATLLEIEPEDREPGRLGLAPISGGRGLYRKHFLDLDGLGIRDLARDGDDLLILAGPTMTLPGTQRLYRLRDARDLVHDSITGADDSQLVPLFDLPTTSGGDNAEGIALRTWPGAQGVMVVYDGPLTARRPKPGTVYADVFRLA
jgi:hypothetical protein